MVLLIKKPFKMFFFLNHNPKKKPFVLLLFDNDLMEISQTQVILQFSSHELPF